MKVKVNGKFDFELEVNNTEISMDQKAVIFDYRSLNARHSSVIYNNKSFNVELIEENRSEKTLVLKVNRNIYHLAIEDQYDQLLKQLGLDYSKTKKVAEVKAPMPGLVLKILVVQEQRVVKGDNLLVLEAMKMENMIKSPTDGIIKRILINIGDKTEKNAVLIEFD
ncbi:acetyl-CoA carboxylase biotin carboxyl carrier protein subunit [Pedobacter sp. JCM 36344]|uniref:acetyl-CoA carboxylase biotin carboxyl carrier protein subunit n=1 Tax=Pedobacter sp. JCM 36344 TaxID=3374280 RepID=UPI00397AB98E